MPRDPASPRPPHLIAATVALALEAAVAFGFGIVEIGQIRGFRAVVGVGVSIIMIGYGVLLAAVARGVLRGRRWSRAPAVATQLILLPIAWSFRAAPTTWVGLAMAAVAVVTLVGVLHPRSTAVFVDDPR